MKIIPYTKINRICYYNSIELNYCVELVFIKNNKNIYQYIEDFQFMTYDSFKHLIKTERKLY